MTTVAAIVAILLGAAVLVDVARSPTIRRIGWRNLGRRPAETAVVVIGSMLATALIVASLVIGDSFGQSTRAAAADRFGEVDEVVTVPDAGSALRLGEALLAEAGPIDHVVVVAIGGASVKADDPLVQLAVRARTTGAEAAGGASPTEEATISSELSERLGVGVGDDFEVVTDNGAHRLVVGQVGDDVLGDRLEIVVWADEGGAGDAASSGGTDYFADAGRLEHRVMVSNVGGATDGAERTDAVVARIEGTAAALGLDELDVRPIKQELLEMADAEAAEMTNLFGTVSGFSVTAGILLVVNLFVMLAAERRRELGLMRAVGLSRGVLVRGFLVEGALTGIAAAVLGAMAGIAVAAGVLGYASSELDEELLSVSVAPRLVVFGALAGFAISQITVTITSLRIARVDITAALKDLPAAGSRSRSWWGRLVAATTITVGVLGTVMAPDQALLALAAPAVTLLGFALLAGPTAGGAVRVALVVGALVWPVAVFTLRSEAMTDPEVGVFLAQGLFLVGTASWLTVLARPAWQWATRRMGATRLGLRLGLAHPLDRPGRTGLLVAMYAIVLFTVTFLAAMTAVYGNSGPALAELAGGRWQVAVDAAGSEAPDAAEVGAVPGVDAVASLAVGVLGVSDERRLTVAGVDDSWLAVDPPGLEQRDAGFPDDAAAWAAVAASGPDAVAWAIAPGGFGYEVGETLLVGAESKPAVVAGITDYGWLIGVDLYVGRALVAEEVGGAERWMVAVQPGSDAGGVAKELADRFGGRGLRAESLESIAAEELVGQRVFLEMLLGYLALGLFIGVAGLAVVLARGAVERRQETAVLVAVGVDQRSVSRSFLAEAVFVGGQGTVLGIGLGLVSAWQVLTRTSAFDEGLTFVWPVGPLALIGSACLAASVLAAVAPARRNSRTEPAASLRVV